MSILTKSGFEQFMRQYYPNLADRTETLQYINEQLIGVLEQYKLDTTKMVPSYEQLPTPGEEGTIYIIPKSTAVERRGQFVCYAYENGEYIQVGSALFPEDVPVDLVINPTSHNAISNMAFKREYDNKHDAADITNAINDHNELIVTSDAIYNEVIKKAEWPNVRRIKNNEVFAIVREDPDYVTMVYPTIILDPVDKATGLVYGHSYSPYDNSYSKTDTSVNVFSNMKFDSWVNDGYNLGVARYAINRESSSIEIMLQDPNSLDIIRVGIHAFVYVGDGDSSITIYLSALEPNVQSNHGSVGRYYYWPTTIRASHGDSSRSCNYALYFEFKDPIPLATLKRMRLNLKPSRNIEFTVKYRTSLATGEYTVVQDKVVYTSSNTYLPCYSS